jgi:hypothetical protein
MLEERGYVDAQNVQLNAKGIDVSFLLYQLISKYYAVDIS